MDYTIHRNNQDEFLIEILRDSFSTKIAFDFDPGNNFYGLAVCCNYHKNGHPVGLLKDNGLIVSKIEGKKFRPSFEVGNSVIQAGPTLIENFEKQKRVKAEEFSTGEIVSGIHVSIGQKKFGNYVIILTKNASLGEITEKLAAMNCQNAIKLPGLKQVGFYFRSTHQVVKYGNFPMPVALVFCPRLQKHADLLSQIV